jgi:hypothetical protein
LQKVYRTNFKKRFLDDEEIIFGKYSEMIEMNNVSSMIAEENTPTINNNIILENDMEPDAIIAEEPVQESPCKTIITIDEMEFSWKDKF